MTTDGGHRVTWVELVALARQLQTDASRNEVRPDDVARLVRMLLRFDQQLTEPVLTRR